MDDRGCERIFGKNVVYKAIVSNVIYLFCIYIYFLQEYPVHRKQADCSIKSNQLCGSGMISGPSHLASFRLL